MVETQTRQTRSIRVIWCSIRDCPFCSNSAGGTPGIVYTPARKQAESVAAELAAHFSTAAYHAGLDTERRQRVQEKFLAGKVDVMVATIAFGMGSTNPISAR
jgi:superfamily II DNA helicase RecQ